MFLAIILALLSGAAGAMFLAILFAPATDGLREREDIARAYAERMYDEVLEECTYFTDCTDK